MMDNRCPICGQNGNEFQEQRSWTETDKYHGAKKFGLKQGAGFIAGQVADAIIPGLGTFASIGAKALTSNYYDEKHPKSKTHYYTYYHYTCDTCNQHWDNDSDGMAMIDNYYAGAYKQYEKVGKALFHIPMLPLYGLGIAFAINVVVLLLVLIFAFFIGFFYFLFADAHYFDQFFTASWWPTVNWIKDFLSFTWIYYAIYIPIILLVFFLKPFIFNCRIDNEVNEKKQALAKRIGIEIS